MENLEKQIVRIIENNSPELAAEEILRLFSVVGRSEQLSPTHNSKKVGDFDNNHNDSFINID
jgi:hypothetical protein